MTAHGRVTTRGDGYKPVPDETVEILERLVDAAEDVIAWYEVVGGNMTGAASLHAMNQLTIAIAEASAYLERTP